jgi:hypothetical protein
MIKTFVKIAGLPNWLHQMHKTINPTKSMPTYSRKGVVGLWRRRMAAK